MSSIPVLTYNGTGSYEPTCLTNGVLGIRPGKNPLLEGSCIVSGFVERSDLLIEQLAKAPYPFYTDLEMNGAKLSEAGENVRLVRQELDLSCGELRTELEWAYAPDDRLNIRLIQYVSRSTPVVAVCHAELTSGSACRVKLFPQIQTDGLGISQYTDDAVMARKMVSASGVSGNTMVKAAGFTYGLNRLGVGLVLASQQVARDDEQGYAAELNAGVPCTFELIAGLVSEIYNPDPHLEAIRMTRWGELIAANNLRQYNRDAWDALWLSRIVVDGATESEQLAIDSSFYYLQANCHYSVVAGYPPYGLTQNAALNGHTFWDMDIWMLPPLALVQPQAARGHIEFRKAGLENARMRAKVYGYRGAQYPWQTTQDGYEGTLAGIATGWSEQHVTPNVAVAAWMYQRIVGDERFMREYTWHILEGVAEWIASRGVWTEKGFEVRHMMGTDEELENVSNDGYFNLVSKMAMGYAIECAEKLGYTVNPEWRRIAERFYLPRSEEGRYLTFDPETRIRKINPATLEVEEVLGIERVDPSRLFLRAQYILHFSPPLDYASFEDTYIADDATQSTWLSYSAAPGTPKAVSFIIPPFSTRACFFGEREKGRFWFQNSYEEYQLAPFQMIREYKFFDFGSYMTTYGAILSAVMMGFTGLRPTEPGYVPFKASLPAGWQKITIGRITLGGKQYRLEATHGAPAQLILLDND